MSKKKGPPRTPLAVRFWSRVIKGDGCWIWTGLRSAYGYGLIGRGGKQAGNMATHRVSWELHNGPIPAGLVVCHKCDNPPCVNPDHLFVGTQRENVNDCVRKGRHRAACQKGEANGNAKLTWADVAVIRAAYVPGRVSQQSLADRFGVPQTTISKIIAGQLWKPQDAPVREV